MYAHLFRKNTNEKDQEKRSSYMNGIRFMFWKALKSN